MDKELVRIFYTLRSTLHLIEACRTDTGMTDPLTLDEYSAMMDAYHSTQKVLTSIYRREVEFFGNKVS